MKWRFNRREAVGKQLDDDKAHGINLKANKVQENWIPPTLLNGWINRGSGLNDVAYYKDNFGVVHFRGTISSGVIGNVIFKLPLGYRPTGLIYLFAFSGDGNGFLTARISIDSNGDVVVDGGSPILLSLEGVSFKAA